MLNPFYKILGWLMRGLVRFIGRIIYRIHVHNGVHIPAEGGALLVANHTSYMDFVLVISSISRPVSFVMNADVYTKPALKWIFKGMNFIPVSPRGGKNDFEEFNKAVADQVHSGRVVVIFAEGTVSRTGQILEFKKGVEHLAARITAPVIPIHFHNVQGTPFTFRAGRKRMESISLNNVRKEIMVGVGEPMQGNVTAFALRQKIKELEVQNFDLHLGKMKSLDDVICDQLGTLEEGSWNYAEKHTRFRDLSRKLNELHRVLDPLLEEDDRVALLLPKGYDTMICQLWMLLHHKVIVPISPELDNEEQFHVMNKARVRTLITTRDIQFTRYAPNADRIIYIEEINAAITNGEPVNVLIKQLNRMQRGVRSLFAPAVNLDSPVVVFFERESREELRCVSLTHRNLLAVIHGLRQVYYFERGSEWMTNLPLYNAFGFVLEFLVPLLHDISLHVVKSDVTEEEFVSKLMETKPSLVIATPAQIESIAALSQVRNIPFLTHVFTADLRPDNHNVEILSERGIEVLVCAGMNETSSVFAVNLHNYRGKDIAGKWMEQENREEESVGKPLPGVALKVCDHQMTQLAPTVEGWLWVKGSCVAPAIAEESECNPKLVDGWYNTGLKGSLNHKGFIRIAG